MKIENLKTLIKEKTKNRKKNLITRPPTVVILGHVDSGKTTLLDFIRKTNVVDQESGGITQHIGAYQIQHQDKLINFIDTPGHEAFSAMRARGAHVADIAVLIIACDQGVKPQTKEAIQAVKKADIPMLVALNKIDLPHTLTRKVKQDLIDCKVQIEEFGGQIPCLEISAKQGQGINELLEMILLMAEMEELKYDPKKSAKGVIVESHLDPRRGPTVTALISEGTLKQNDVILAEDSFGKIKTLENINFHSLKKAAAAPVVITGLNHVPPVGANFKIVKSLLQANQLAQKNKTQALKRKPKTQILNLQPDQKTCNIILKVDVAGSGEAIQECLKVIPQKEVILRLLYSGVGNISESDVKLAAASRAQIFGFRVNIDPGAKNLARQQKIKIQIFKVIYELIENIRQVLTQLLSPKISEESLGKGKIIAIFKQDKRSMIVGAKITKGKIIQGAQMRVLRDKKIIGQGRIKELQFEKKKVAELQVGKNAGISLDGCVLIEKGDTIEVYRQTKEKKELV